MNIPAPAAPRARYDGFLEGLRGAAALYVVMHHVHLYLGWIDGLGPLASLRRAFSFGHYAVAVFIVLSGYCLMLPVAASPSGELRGGFRAYIFRRAKRILPPYMATLAMVLTVVALVPHWQDFTGFRWDMSLPAWKTDVILSHVFLVHNLQEDWIFKIDAPLWSVATEWQIYFTFPLLLWSWRRFGMAVTVTLAFLVGYGIFLIGFSMRQVAAVEACPWYLGLFALGMATAVRTTRFPNAPRQPWLGLSLACLVFAVGWSILEERIKLLDDHGVPRRVFLDSVMGAATAYLIIHCARSSAKPGQSHSWIVRILESRPSRWLGSFSYSLYLIHDPLLAWLDITMHDLGLTGYERLAVMVLGGFPGVILAAYLFYLVFERPFLNRARQPG